jgi:hypothetical protein
LLRFGLSLGVQCEKSLGDGGSENLIRHARLQRVGDKHVDISKNGNQKTQHRGERSDNDVMPHRPIDQHLGRIAGSNKLCRQPGRIAGFHQPVAAAGDQ